MAGSIFEYASFFLAVIFFFLHVGDIATDIIVCVTYYNGGLTNFFYATLAFILIPFVYIVYYCPHEVGGLDGMSCSGVYSATLSSYFLGPLFPYVAKSSMSQENVRKVAGFAIFGSGYMEDIPQVIIACAFLFSGASGEKKSNHEQLFALIQLGFSAICGIYKMVSGAGKVGNGTINCCNMNIKLNCC